MEPDAAHTFLVYTAAIERFVTTASRPGIATLAGASQA